MSLKRRHFLTGLALLPAATLSQLKKGAGRPDDERYWERVRSHFLIPDHISYLNNGSLGVTPKPVIEAMHRHLIETETIGTRKYGDYPWWGYGPSLEIREKLAEFLGAAADELALVRNATEGVNTVAFGLDLKAGDVVLMTDEEHPGGKSAWYQRAKREGIEVRTFRLPRPATSPSEILERLEGALTSRTRVISVSHITTSTGAILPAREISTLARSRGIISLIDGAHAIGQIPLNLQELGCDYYATSPHKWLYAPKGTGLLYCRKGMAARLWSHTASGSWDMRELGAERLGNLGTSNLTLLVGLLAAVDFHQAIGSKNISDRLQYLVGVLRSRFRQEFPAVRFLTGPPPAFSCGMIKLGLAFENVGDLGEKLWTRHNIWVQSGDADPVLGIPGSLRISCPVYVRPKDLERLIAALKKEL